MIISILSGKGGVGKTTTSSNVATALANLFKRKVIVLDGNSSSHIKFHFGANKEEIEKTLGDVLKNRRELKNALIYNSNTNVHIIPSPENEFELNKLKRLVTHLATSQYDFVIIDGPPGFGESVDKLIKASDKIIVVVNPFLPDISDASRIIQKIRKYKKDFVVVVNKCKKRDYEMKIEEISKLLNTKKIFVIPEDENIFRSLSLGLPVVIFKKSSKAAIMFKKLAAYLANEVYEPSFFEKVRSIFNF